MTSQSLGDSARRTGACGDPGNVRAINGGGHEKTSIEATLSLDGRQMRVPRVFAASRSRGAMSPGVTNVRIRPTRETVSRPATLQPGVSRTPTTARVLPRFDRSLGPFSQLSLVHEACSVGDHGSPEAARKGLTCVKNFHCAASSVSKVIHQALDDLPLCTPRTLFPVGLGCRGGWSGV